MAVAQERLVEVDVAEPRFGVIAHAPRVARGAAAAPPF